jgi:DMSO reductase family type II enzyme heme b subunit
MRMRSIPWLVLAAVAGCGGQAPPAAVTEVVAVRRPALPDDPAAAAWTDVPVYHAALLPQDVVEPRLLAPSTAGVDVQAVTDGTRVAFRLTWPDATQNDLPDTGRFSDACAVQLPATTAADVPAPQMGEAGRPVEITYWRATWQAAVDGRPDTVAAIHPGAAVDHYPFEAASLKPGSPEQEAMARRYAPARALGNEMAGPRTRPVQDLLAVGPGTLHPAPDGHSTGHGRRTDAGWAVVLSRPLPERLAPQERTQVAFAVWDGAHQEAGARKMRTGWVSMLVEGAP